jgi:hypothetical protein
MGFSSAIILGFFLFLAAGSLSAEERVPIGVVEDVILLPWGIKMPARIDTGAARSSLDARELKVKDEIAEFKLPKKYGGRKIKLPVVKWVDTRSSEARDRRPVVELTFCVGSRRIRTEVNLNDRSTVRYPLIIGRDVLKENFIVDCLKSRCLPPTCPEASTK